MEKIGVLGSGVVGNTIATKLNQLGYNVMMGSRSATNAKAVAWAESCKKDASPGTFTDTAKFASIIFNCTKGEVALEIFERAGVENFNDKLVIDVSNPLDFSKGMPPSLIPEYTNTKSLGEEIQKLMPKAKVVKTLNIVNCEVMVDPKKSGGDPTMFISGDDKGAKEKTVNILKQFGWNDIIDLGDITTARGMEMLLPIWLRTYMATGNGYFAFKILR